MGPIPEAARSERFDLSVAGCSISPISYYSGSFTITTSEGMLTGSASGAESESTIGTPPSVYDEFPLDLTATAGTGPVCRHDRKCAGPPRCSTNLTAFQGTVDDTFTQVLYPQGGVGRGVTYLDAGAYETSGVSITGVVFELNGHIIATATPTLYGWLAAWNTTTSTSSTYELVSVATDSNDKTLTSYPETIQVDNPPPTTTILIPSSGASFSGTSAVLDATASSPDGAPISVTFTGSGALNGVFGSLGKATPTLYGYIFVWNTTAVPNGTYTLASLVTDVAGNFEYSTQVSVTVANSTPTTAILIPSSGTSVSGTVLLDANASANVTYVAFELSGGTINGEKLIATATRTYYGWLAEWNTTSVPNGRYTIQSVASYSPYFSGGTTAPVTITVAN